MKREHAYKIREILYKASAFISDEDALEAKELFALWKKDKQYETNERVRFDNKLYKCVQAHTSQEGWEPPTVPALWTEVAKPGEIPVWKQPTGAQDAYKKDDKVHFPTVDDPIYISLYDNNVWSPTVYGWELFL